MSKKNEHYYITTPIYYPSAKLHIGHTYSTTIADCMARFKRLAGYDVFFLTGSDEHGQKIQRAAQAKGITPIEYTDQIVAGFQKLWEKLNISHDDFIRTTEKRHEKVVQELFQKAYDKGDIYKTVYEGWYCTPCETYWTEQKLGENHTCPDCGRPVERLQEESYFFKMSKYVDRWFQFIEEHPDFIQPESRRNEMIQFVKQGLEDLCVSRTTFDWGIKVPFDNKHVVYVWFDALVNYISAIGYLDDPEKFKKFWPASCHLVGKEIVRFHTIIWPIMLMSLDIPLPEKVYGHGWLIVDGTKMSKSLGNVIDPIPLIDQYGADTLRYYLLSDIHLGSDGNFTLPGFVQKINSDLSNDLGNLLHRTLSMVEKYHDGVILGGFEEEPVDKELKAFEKEAITAYETHMETMHINDGIKALWGLINRGNKYIDETMPWALGKDESKKERLSTVMYNLLEILRKIAILVGPIMPTCGPAMWEQLGLTDYETMTLDDAKAWGLMRAGAKIKKGNPIFPRFDMPEMVDVSKEVLAPVITDSKESAAEGDETLIIDPFKENIEYDDFAKMDLRIAKVIACEKVKKSKKLLKVTLQVGLEERTVVSGISNYYEPETMIGKHVIYLANLAPKKLMGIESQGMILAASNSREELVVPEVPSMPAGSIVK